MIKKECILLVGPPGAGKTVLALSLVAKYIDEGVVRISKEQQGTSGHIEKYKAAIKHGTPKIIIDNNNPNMYQRRRYIEFAKKNGYYVNIIDVTTDPTTCFHRVLTRKDNEVKSDQGKTAVLKELYAYYSQYNKPKKEEADNVEDRTDFNPNLLDLTDKLKGEKYFIVGDIHGCFNEFIKLLIEAKTHNVVSVGDLIDKGPKIRETLLFFMSNTNSYTCMGNHENKFLRYLIGNKVNTESLKETIEQTTSIDKYSLALFLMTMPKMIKEGNNYIFHGGINPFKDLEDQKSEDLMYGRHFNPENSELEETKESKYWHEYINNNNPKVRSTNRFFGHHYHSDIKVAHNTYALDGHCVYGKELRACLMPSKKIITYKAKTQYKNPINSTSFMPSHIEEYEKLVQYGHIAKNTLGPDIVSYKYTEKCKKESNWNEYTRKANNIIFNKKTGECLARSHDKFFDLNECVESELSIMPKDGYKLLDLLDGDLGVLYWYNGEPRVYAGGAFDSPASLKATEILKEKGYYNKLKSNIYPFSRSLTLIFEIIYPENKKVCDYLNITDLFLTGAIDRLTGYDYDIYGDELKSYLDYIGCSRVILYPDADLKEVVNSMSVVSKNKKGWVYRHHTGFKVKIKGDAYSKVKNAINYMDPISLWDSMVNGKISDEFLQDMPKDVSKTVMLAKNNLESRYSLEKQKMLFEIDLMFKDIGFGALSSKEYRIKIGTYLKNNTTSYGSMFFPYLLRKDNIIDAIISKKIKPDRSVL